MNTHSDGYIGYYGYVLCLDSWCCHAWVVGVAKLTCLLDIRGLKVRVIVMIVCCCLVGAIDGFGQEGVKLSLMEVVTMAKGQSIAARQAATTKETKYWEYRTYQSNYQPQLLLNGSLPAFTRSFQQVVQPDGTILYQPVQNNNSSVGLQLSQSVAATGGTLFATTQLQRYDDFANRNTLYNGTLFGVGFYQPLFRLNPLKWDKKIEPLKYNESQQAYIESLERIALSATEYYFDLLLAQVNLKISEANLSSTGNILRIAKEKFALGKVSRNEILQLELEQLKARKASASAKRDVETAGLNLRSYIGLGGEAKLTLKEDLPGVGIEVSADMALREAYENRADAIGFERRALEAERAVAKAKGDNGLNANLNATLGFSNRGTRLTDLPNQPQNSETVQIDFMVPVLDWGRSKARLKTAEANRQLTQYSVEQDKQSFKQEIYTQVALFAMLREQLELTIQADSIASEKFKIANERYILGNLSITDLSIAFQEKDQAKRDYIGGLRDYWAAFYRLRWLTLYDFEKGVKIK